MTLLRVVGVSGAKIFYFSSNPEEITQGDTGMEQLRTFSLPLDSLLSRIGSAFRIKVYDPSVEIYALNMHAIIRFNLVSGKLTRMDLPHNYTRIIKVSNSSYIVKGCDNTADNDYLYKINFANNTIIKRPGLLDQRFDAGLSTDGNIRYDSAHNVVVYVHLYCNKILYLDTNLNLLAASRSIDTFYDYQLIGKKFRNKNRSFFTQARPPRYVNYTCCLHGRRLYINSLIKADNESDAAYHLNSVIDMYDMDIKKYLGSFYVPKYHNERLRTFYITDTMLVATYPDAVVSYIIR